MAQVEQPSTGEDYSGDASASASWGDFEESPPVPFPPSFPEFPRNEERFAGMNTFAGMNNEGSLMNNEGSAVVRNDPKACFVASATFSFFVAMTMAFGLYGSETLRLGPNTSVLLQPNHLFVKSIKVVEIGSAKGLMLYGFYKVPHLDSMITWPETHKISLPGGTHKEWIYYLNEGSQLNISYSVVSSRSSSLVLVIAKGNSDFAEWLKDPSYPNTTLSWNIIHGNGSIQKDISESSTYYIGVGNLNSELVKVYLNATIKAFLYNTTEPYYKCEPAERQCTFQLFFLGGNVAVLTSPGRMPGMISGDWYVKLSYGPRWYTYFVGAGAMTFLLLLINYFTSFRRIEQDTPRGQLGDTGSERNPLLSHKDDNISSQDSSYASVSEDEGYEEDAQAGVEQCRKPLKDEEYNRRLCSICFDAPKDCFFIPCGHCVACFGCSTRILETSGACPICRRNIKKVRKIYTV